MSSLRTLEFVLVSADYSTLTAVSAGVKKFGAALTFVPNSGSARNCLARRKTLRANISETSLVPLINEQ